MKPDNFVFPRNSEEARENLKRIADAQGETLAGLSRFIGRRDGYLHAYISAGIPQALRTPERQLLARYFGIDEREIAVPPAEASL